MKKQKLVVIGNGMAGARTVRRDSGSRRRAASSTSPCLARNRPGTIIAFCCRTF